jgi:membrane protease subunit (stomatin/prohibitin family)
MLLVALFLKITKKSQEELEKIVKMNMVGRLQRKTLQYSTADGLKNLVVCSDCG